MAYDCGWAALNLEMPERVPRTEYSAAEYHWPLVERVTGIRIGKDSTPEERFRATAAFRRAWTYDFNWNVLINTQVYGGLYTRMGHAVYDGEGRDFDDRISCPFEDVEEVLNFDPFEAFGEVDEAEATRRFEEHYRASKAAFPDEVNMTGVYTTLMSGLIAVFGWDMLLLACGEDSRAFGKMTDRYAQWMQQYMNALAEADVPCVMIHDDIVWTQGAFLRPEWYRKYIFPNYKRYFAPIIESGKKLVYTSDGNYTEFLGDLVDTGVHGFVLEPMTDMKEIAERYGKTHAFIGNADTRILLSGTPEDIRAEVKRCMDIGKGCPGFFMAVGNHIPANTPVENCLIYEEAYRSMCRR